MRSRGFGIHREKRNLTALKLENEKSHSKSILILTLERATKLHIGMIADLLSEVEANPSVFRLFSLFSWCHYLFSSSSPPSFTASKGIGHSQFQCSSILASFLFFSLCVKPPTHELHKLPKHKQHFSTPY